MIYYVDLVMCIYSEWKMLYIVCMYLKLNGKYILNLSFGGLCRELLL